MDLFVLPPRIDAVEYLGERAATKLAGVRLTQPPSYWGDEITQILMRDHPYIPTDRVAVTFKKMDAAQGAGLGYISIMGAPTVTIPVIIKNRELAPLDILVIRGENDTGTEEGTNDMQSDKVLPLTEDTFSQAMDTSDVGEPVSQAHMTNTGWTEDGSSLRLPFRGRTVIASFVMGVDPKKKEKLAALLAADKTLIAGFVHNGSSDVLLEWHNGKPSYNLFQQKLGSVPVKLATAAVLNELPVEVSGRDFIAGPIYLDNGETKVAAAFDAVNLAKPDQESRFLAFSDGTFQRAPDRMAVTSDLTGEQKTAHAMDVLQACKASSLRRGAMVSFHLNGHVTTPAKIASILVDESKHSVRVDMTDDLGRRYPVELVRGLKQATYDKKSASWAIPITAPVIQFKEGDGEPVMAIEKVAKTLENILPDRLICTGGSFTLLLKGEPFGGSQISEEKMAALLTTCLTNGQEILETVKVAAAQAVSGTANIRFQSNLGDQLAEVQKLASYRALFTELPEVKKLLEQAGLPLEMAVKLAATIGDPQSVDAILGAGFLTEDNIAEFLSLADFFEEAVEKLARLLLSIRMGFPGDENATMVAMKSLQRVTEALRGATQEANG